MHILYFVAVLLLLPAGDGSISPGQAQKHIGETTTVCGLVAGGRFVESSRGEPTFLDFEKPYPKNDFTVLIWGRDRQNFGTPERDWIQKQICVRGKIESYQGRAEVILHEKSQIVSDHFAK